MSQQIDTPISIGGSSRPYQMCTRCVMDTSDSDIEFDADGICNHCRDYLIGVEKYLISVSERSDALAHLVKKIKESGRNSEYDCIIGVSGGVDSTYLAYLVREQGLRPLAVHMDNGWNSELAVSNIEKVLKKLDIDLYTYVLDWEEFKDLQIAFLRASVSDAEIPTDHAIWSVLYKTAATHNVKYILLGANYATESILPRSWTYGILDWRYISKIYEQFGGGALKTYPHTSFWMRSFYYPHVKGIKVVDFLNYIEFSKSEAMRVLEQELEWRPYGGKHYESIYTRFFQGYILPNKFGIDKRRAHLSTLIMSEQVNRGEALAELANPPYSGYMLEEDMDYMLKKFNFTPEEFNELMSIPTKTYQDYPNDAVLEQRVNSLIRKIQPGMWLRRLKLRS